MEFCTNCQTIKPYRVEEFCVSRLLKVCRDCGIAMGHIEIPDLNKIINELIFYKEKFYERELKNEKET